MNNEMYTAQHVVKPVFCTCDEQHQHYECKKQDCWFDATNLSDVAFHVTKNQFVVTKN